MTFSDFLLYASFGFGLFVGICFVFNSICELIGMLYHTFIEVFLEGTPHNNDEYRFVPRNCPVISVGMETETETTVEKSDSE